MTDQPAKRKVALPLALALCLALGATDGWTQPVVSNVVTTVAGDGSVEIVYDVNDPGDELLQVTLLISDDGGSCFSHVPTTVTGAVGDDILEGTGKTIVWNPTLLEIANLRGALIARVCAVAISDASPFEVDVPGLDFPTIQQGIDAVALGGIVRVSSGEFRENLTIAKPVQILGSGAEGAVRTAIMDTTPTEIVSSDLALGVINYLPGGGGVIKDLALVGADAGIVGMESGAGGGSPGSVEVERVVIEDTGRGILWTSPSGLSVNDTEIRNTLWNGISVAPEYTGELLDLNLMSNGLQLINPGGAGLYFSHTFGVVDNATIQNATAGGIVGFESKVHISNSLLQLNKEAGILLVNSNVFPFLVNKIENNVIDDTLPLQGLLGDGISLWGSNSDVTDNSIGNSARVGLMNFGSVVRLQGNQITCSSIDLGGASYETADPQFLDLGGNQCGCGSLGSCAANTGSPEAPPPKGGLE